MLGVSGMLGDSGDGAAAAAEARESATTNGAGGRGDVGGGAGPSSAGGLGEEDKVRIHHKELGDRNSGGNRWPRQETLALLKIRSDMDVAFRDSSLKGPLWEEVSRKLAELGYHRSAKKCREKFENVYKYHKRTREVRSTKQDGKTYRFFDQLEALENHPSPPFLITSPRPQTHHIITPASPVAVAMPGCTNPPFVTVPSTANPTNASQNKATPAIINPTNPQPPPAATITNPIYISSYGTSVPPCLQNMSANKWPVSTSSSTSSDEEPERRSRRKRKWADLFQTLMNEVIAKQEEMQKKFIETLEKRERDRVAREEAWRVQEMARMNREHELLVQERSIAAAKDAAVIAFLEKVSEQQIPNVPQMQMQIQLVRSHDNNSVPQPPQALLLQPTPPQPQPQPPPPLNPPLKSPDYPKIDNGGENFGPITSSSRWPKAEVQALIRLRTNMDTNYQENGPKGPMWEEISGAMSKLGYNRNAKRCKEKWENINKYFKKVKDSNKKRSEDSKTCPYFHLLDALYKEKANKNDNSFTKPAEHPMVPIMVQPEQQWPLPQPGATDQDQDDSENNDRLNNNDEEDEDEEDDAGAYEIVANKPSSVGGTVE